MTDLITENARLRAALTCLLEPFEGDPCRYDHHGKCQAHFLEEECCVAKARAALATPAPDAVQEAARVPEIAALIEAAGALGVRGMVAGWNGEGREHPYTPHPASLWAKINTTCGAVYALDAALRAIAGDRT